MTLSSSWGLTGALAVSPPSPLRIIDLPGISTVVRRGFLDPMLVDFADLDSVISVG
jgi:hypothetical protein